MLPISASIITKSKFIQVSLKVFGINSVMCSPKPSFKVTCYPMNPGENLSSSFSGFLNFRLVPVSVSLEPKITIPAIGIDLASGNNVPANKLMKGILRHIRDYPQTDSSCMVSPVFNSNHHRNFHIRSSSTFSFTGSSDVSIINFHSPGKRFSHWINHCSTQTSAQIQGCSVRTDTQLSLKLQSGNTGRQGTHKISSPKPVTNRKMTVLNNGSCSYPYILFTFTATESTQSNIPCSVMSAPGTFKPIRPSHTYQIGNTCLFGRKPALEFAKRAWKLGVTLGCAFCSHFLYILAYLVPSSA